MNHSSSKVYCRCGSVYRTCHINFHTRIKTILLSYSRHFSRCQHYSQTQKRMRLHRYKPHKQKSRLHKGCKADSNNLLAPPDKSIRKSPRKTEKVERTYRYLRKQNSASLYIAEKTFYYTISKADEYVVPSEELIASPIPVISSEIQSNIFFTSF